MENLLKQLGPNVARKVGDKSLRAAAKPILVEAKRLVPVRTGLLRKSIVIRSEIAANRSQDTRGVLIGITRPAGRRAHFTEFGTSHSAAHPFLRPAFDTRAAQSITAMGRVLGDGIDKEAQALDKGIK